MKSQHTWPIEKQFEVTNYLFHGVPITCEKYI